MVREVKVYENQAPPEGLEGVTIPASTLPVERENIKEYAAKNGYVVVYLYTDADGQRMITFIPDEWAWLKDKFKK